MALQKLEDLRVFRVGAIISRLYNGSRAESEVKALGVFFKDCGPILCTCGDIFALLRENAIDFFSTTVKETLPM